MDRAKELAKLAALVALFALALALLALALQLRTDEMRLAAKTDSLIDQAGITVRAANELTAHQDSALKRTTEATTKLIINTDHSLNGWQNCTKCPGGILPAFTKVLGTADTLLRNEDERMKGTHGELDAALKQTTSGLGQATRALNTIADTLGDPAIKTTIGNIAKTSDNVNGISAEGVTQMKSLSKMADDVQQYTHKKLNPTKAEQARGAAWILLKLLLSRYPF